MIRLSFGYELLALHKAPALGYRYGISRTIRYGNGGSTVVLVTAHVRREGRQSPGSGTPQPWPFLLHVWAGAGSLTGVVSIGGVASRSWRTPVNFRMRCTPRRRL
jgi:hypothetical protein